jgi:hypothetical protein
LHKAELFVGAGASSLQISRLNPAVCVPKLYNALPAEIRSIRAYKRFMSAYCVNLCTSTGTTLPRSILMRRVLFNLSLSTSVYNFFIVHFSDA